MKLALIPTLAVSLALTTVVDVFAATTLTTPFVAASVDGVCLVTNASRKPIVVTGRLLDQLGGAYTPAVDTCSPTPVQPGATCAIGAVTSMPPGATYIGFSCSIVSSSNKVRAIGYGFNGAGTALIVVPATAK